MPLRFETMSEAERVAQDASAGLYVGCRVTIGEIDHVLDALGPTGPQWRPVAAVPPLRKFSTVQGVRSALRGKSLKVHDEFEYTCGRRGTIAAVDDSDFVVVLDNGEQHTYSLHDGVGGEPVGEPAPPLRARTLPDDDAERKAIPLFAGCLLYFPAALVEVAKCSKRGNNQHNPGQPLHWARGKSMAQLESQLHHMLDQAESTGAERIEHLAANAWRALAELQLECERQGAPLAPSAKEPKP